MSKFIKEKGQKILYTIILSFTLMLPVVANAASYKGLSYSLKAHLSGSTRSYASGTIKVKTYNCTTENNGYSPADNIFTISLYKDGFWSDTCIGSATYQRTSSTTQSWTNMSSGKYYISISKTTDGCRIKGNIDITQ